MVLIKILPFKKDPRGNFKLILKKKKNLWCNYSLVKRGSLSVLNKWKFTHELVNFDYVQKYFVWLSHFTHCLYLKYALSFAKPHRALTNSFIFISSILDLRTFPHTEAFCFLEKIKKKHTKNQKMYKNKIISKKISSSSGRQKAKRSINKRENQPATQVGWTPKQIWDPKSN